MRTAAHPAPDQRHDCACASALTSLQLAIAAACAPSPRQYVAGRCRNCVLVHVTCCRKPAVQVVSSTSCDCTIFLVRATIFLVAVRLHVVSIESSRSLKPSGGLAEADQLQCSRVVDACQRASVYFVSVVRAGTCAIYSCNEWVLTVVLDGSGRRFIKIVSLWRALLEAKVQAASPCAVLSSVRVLFFARVS